MSWPATGDAAATRRAGQGPRLHAAGRRRRARRARPRRRPALLHPGPRRLRAVRRPRPAARASIWRSGSASPNARSGDAAFRETLLAAARHAADIGDTDRLVAAALANNRGMFSAAGDRRRRTVDILELALDRLPSDHPSRALLLATSAPSSPSTSSLERRQALADEAIAIARSIGDDATIVRVLNNVSWPLAMPQLLDQITGMVGRGASTRRTPRRPRAAVLGRPPPRRRRPPRRRHRRDGSLLRDRLVARRTARRADLLWQRATMRALRAQLAGDTDAAEALTIEAFHIATDSGQPDAAAFLAVQQGAVAIQRGIDAGDITPMLENLARQLPNQKPADHGGHRDEPRRHGSTRRRPSAAAGVRRLRVRPATRLPAAGSSR